MAVEFVMPKLGLTMETGTIVGWLVEDGTEVHPGQPVLVIETDKVESEVEATGAGRFHHLGEVGVEYPCGAPIGWLLDPGEDVPTPVTGAGTTTPSPTRPQSMTAEGSTAGRPPAGGSAAVATTGPGGRLPASPNARRVAAERGIDLRTIAGTGPGGRITSEDVPTRPPPEVGSVRVGAIPVDPAVPAPVGSPVSAAPRSSPEPSGLATVAARQLADLLGIDLGAVSPAGPDPRIERADVAAHVRALLARVPSGTAHPTTDPPGVTPPAPAMQSPATIVPLRGMRGTIAERMSRSLHSMAQLTLTMDVDMDGVVADRTARKQAAGGDTVVPGYTDYVIASVAGALVEHPMVNSQITAEGVALLPRVNIGLAVALDDGLIVPVIPDTPALALEELAAETARMADAARAGKLKLGELEGGTFSVTALGMFGVDAFTPIINVPNTAVLGVGRLRDEVAWSADGRPERTSRLTLSLTWDHRAFDGAPAAEFTRSVKTGLEAYLDQDRL